MAKQITSQAHDCLHQEDFGRIMTIIERHEKSLYGNGRDGVERRVGGLENKVDSHDQIMKTITEDTKELTKSVNGLTAIYKEKEIEKVALQKYIDEKFNEKQRRQTRINSVGGLIIGILMLSMVILGFIFTNFIRN